MFRTHPGRRCTVAFHGITNVLIRPVPNARTRVFPFRSGIRGPIVRHFRTPLSSRCSRIFLPVGRIRGRPAALLFPVRGCHRIRGFGCITDVPTRAGIRGVRSIHAGSRAAAGNCAFHAGSSFSPVRGRPFKRYVTARAILHHEIPRYIEQLPAGTAVNFTISRPGFGYTDAENRKTVRASGVLLVHGKFAGQSRFIFRYYP